MTAREILDRHAAEFQEATGLQIELGEDGGGRIFIVIRQVPFPPGLFGVDKSDVLFITDRQYPYSALDMFWTDRDSNRIPNSIVRNCSPQLVVDNGTPIIVISNNIDSTVVRGPVRIRDVRYAVLDRAVSLARLNNFDSSFNASLQVLFQGDTDIPPGGKFSRQVPGGAQPGQWVVARWDNFAPAIQGYDSSAARDWFEVKVPARGGGQQGWIQLPSMPAGPKNKNVKDGGCIAYKPDSTGEYVYGLKGNGRCEFYRYNIATNTWVAKESIPAIGRSGKKKPVKKGAAIAAYPIWKHTKNEEETCWVVCCTKGNATLDFWRYNPRLSGTPTYPWAQLADIPAGAKPVKEGAGMVRIPVNDTMRVFLLKGSGTQEFYRYTHITAAWATMAPAPLGASGKTWKNGSCIAYDSLNHTIYALKGSYNELHAYDVATNTWTAKASLPLVGSLGKKKKCKDGGGIAYLGGELYAQKGGGTREFWCYNPATDAWTQTEDMPVGGGKPVKGGGGLCAGTNSTYSLKGNNTLEFFSYTPAAFDQLQAASFKPQTEAQAQAPSSSFKLEVSPSPFTGATTIRYALPRAGNATLKLYDVAGQLVSTLANGYHNAGASSFALQASSLPAGIYILRLSSETTTLTQKLIIE